MASKLASELHPTPAPTPNYDTEVLAPLRAAQALAAQQAAQRAAAALAAQQAAQAAEAAQTAAVQVSAPITTGDHTALMAEAGISPSDYGYVDFIVSHESGWVIQWNHGGSGAYGLCQALPGSKMASAGSDWQTNPVTELIWCSSYAADRYGGWAGAYGFWTSHNWW